jgi:hydrogenase maturation protease
VDEAGATHRDGGFVVVGIGNRERGDDGAGPVLVDRLRDHPARKRMRLSTIGGDMLALMDHLTGTHTLVLVDAMLSGAVPGTVRRLDASTEALAAGRHAFVSTHAIALGEAIELARALGRLPPRVIVYGIEIGGLASGSRLSLAVAAAVRRVAGEIIAMVDGDAGGRVAADQP